MHNEIVLLDLWKPYRLPGAPTWNENPYNNNSWQVYYHGLLHVSYLLNGFEQASDPAFLERAQWYIRSWCEHHPTITDPKEGWAWRDHSTAMRAITLVYFWRLWRSVRAVDRTFDGRLLDTLQLHATHLADDRYYARTNHGIMQDQALLGIAHGVPELPQAAEWSLKARARLQDRCREDVTPSGVHREHSPKYHVHVMRLLERIKTFLEKHCCYGGEFDDVLTRMQTVLFYYVPVDMQLPLVGDTTPLDIRDLLDRPPTDAYVRYVVTRGYEGTEPPLLDFVCLDGGVAVLRDSWRSDTPVHLLLTAAFHSVTHKHADDLSFTLKIGPTEFLVDSGAFNYDDSSLMRRYMRSVHAHNSLAVDDDTYPIIPRAAGRSRIESCDAGPSVSTVVASHMLYDGVFIRRMVRHEKRGVITIVDRPESAGVHNYSQRFHCGEHVEVHVGSKNSIVLRSRIDGTTVRIEQQGQVDAFRRYRGSETPLRGWQSRSFGATHPIDTVEFCKRGRTVEFITTITIGG